MWRALIFAAVIAAGHPRLDGYRPAVLDRVLREAYRGLTGSAAAAPSALLDYTRQLRIVSDALDRFNRTL